MQILGERSAKESKLPKLPNGRTVEYQIYRCCERLSVSLDWFYEQDKTMQTKLIAYAQIREVEDASLLQASLSIGLAHGI